MVLAYVDGNPDKPLGIGFVPNAAAAMVFSLAVSATPWGLLGKLIGTLVVDVVFGCLGNLTSFKYEQMLKNQAKAREEE